jgi:hypothetical protein
VTQAIGEPPILLPISVMATLRHVVVEVGRKETGLVSWHPLDCPLKPWKLSEACGAAASLTDEPDRRQRPDGWWPPGRVPGDSEPAEPEPEASAVQEATPPRR